MKQSKILVLLAMSVLLLSCQLTNVFSSLSPTPTPTARPKPTATPPVAQVVAPPAPTAAPPTEPPLIAATIRENNLRVRAAPNATAAILDRLNKGDRVQVVGRNASNDWLQILLPRDPNIRGWISAAFADLSVPIDTLPLAPAAPRPYP